MSRASNANVVVTIDDDDVIRLKWTEGATITEEDAEQAMAFVNDISADRHRPMIVDMSETAAVTRAARTVFLIPCAADVIALLGRSPVDRVVANFVLGVSNLPCPTRFFTDERAAMAWIAQARP